MTKFTKKEIQNAFSELLSEKPFESITVKEISERAGINRNTFYYNYRDIYDLVDEILQERMAEIIEENKDCASWRDILLCAADFAMQNKKAISHLHHSAKRDELERYVRNIISRTMGKYVWTVADGSKLSEEDIVFVTDFYSCALSGIMTKWLDSNLKNNFYSVVDKLGIMFDANVKDAIERIAESKK